MKRACPALVAATLLATALLGGQSFAADKKVVVENFSGPDADDLRKVVQKVLKGMSGYELVSDKKLAAAEADLGLMQASDAYEAVGKQLGATAFINGKVSGRFRATGIRPKCNDRLAAAGHPLPMDMFEHVQLVA